MNEVSISVNKLSKHERLSNCYTDDKIHLRQFGWHLYGTHFWNSTQKVANDRPDFLLLFENIVMALLI